MSRKSKKSKSMSKGNDELIQGQTYLIAPDDYVHIYGKEMATQKTSGTQGGKGRDSRTKTSRSQERKSKRSTDRSRKSKRETATTTTTKKTDQLSDLPTAMIAPSDYVAIYHKDNQSANRPSAQSSNQSSAAKPKESRTQAQALADGSNQNNKAEPTPGDALPTAMIAPEDYIHIFKGPG